MSIREMFEIFILLQLVEGFFNYYVLMKISKNEINYKEFKTYLHIFMLASITTVVKFLVPHWHFVTVSQILLLLYSLAINKFKIKITLISRFIIFATIFIIEVSYVEFATYIGIDFYSITIFQSFLLSVPCRIVEWNILKLVTREVLSRRCFKWVKRIGARL